MGLQLHFVNRTRGGSRAAATSRMERFMIIVNDFQQPLTIITKRSILDVAAALDPILRTIKSKKATERKFFVIELKRIIEAFLQKQ